MLPVGLFSQPVDAAISYEVPKFFKNFKQVENWEGAKNVRIPHILRTLPNFLVFLKYDFSGHHLNTP